MIVTVYMYRKPNARHRKRVRAGSKPGDQSHRQTNHTRVRQGIKRQNRKAGSEQAGQIQKLSTGELCTDT